MFLPHADWQKSCILQFMKDILESICRWFISKWNILSTSLFLYTVFCSIYNPDTSSNTLKIVNQCKPYCNLMDLGRGFWFKKWFNWCWYFPPLYSLSYFQENLSFRIPNLFLHITLKGNKNILQYTSLACFCSNMLEDLFLHYACDLFHPPYLCHPEKDWKNHHQWCVVIVSNLLLTCVIISSLNNDNIF